MIAIATFSNKGRPAKKRAGRCNTPQCRRPARKNRKFCNTCRDRKWREANPIAHLWKNLKSHAKARKKDFTITRERFAEFCEKTGYHIDHGREKDGMTIDRRDERFGYHIWNIQVLTNSQNAAKKYVPYFQSLANAAHHEPEPTPAGVEF